MEHQPEPIRNHSGEPRKNSKKYGGMLSWSVYFLSPMKYGMVLAISCLIQYILATLIINLHYVPEGKL